MRALTAFPGMPKTLLGLGVFVLLAMSLSAMAQDRHKKPDFLHIGATPSLHPQGRDHQRDKGALANLQSFIKDETGLANDIQQQKDWLQLAEKMAKGQLQLGVFQGYEFAWAKQKYPKLIPLALAINVYRYPVAYVLVNAGSTVKDFAGLKGQSLSLPDTGQRYLNLFVEHQTEALGKEPSAFFSKIKSPDNFDDALDDVVDGVVTAAIADGAALESYKRRKPGRFNKLKELAKSDPFPPPVVAHFDNQLAESTLAQFRKGLLNASHTDRGQTMLMLFHVTGFELPPSDFEHVLAHTLKTYPPPRDKEGQ